MTKLLFAMLLFVQIQPHSAPVFLHPGFKAGEEFLDLTASERASYTMGLIDGLLASPLMAKEAEPNATQLNKCITGKTNTQVAEIVRRYINDIPTRWDVAANVLAFEALINACKPN